MKRFGIWSIVAILSLCTTAFAADAKNPRVRLTTSLGAIEIELYADKAPASAKNFLEYVDAGFYNGTVFHRVIPAFMIQGGGFEPGLKQKQARASIQNEADNGLTNVTGTLAMARTPDPHSASAQFFINTKDNDFLNHQSKTPQGWGYAVFGKVTKGMDVVKKIEAVPTRNAGGHGNVPVNDVVIQKAERIGK
ncbi:MAG TPA: peptidylprolyl isomerase [Burkholderiales bacterium]|nr:peptidylprolyl isomerase [Burkholderiales bacterium]